MIHRTMIRTMIQILDAGNNPWIMLFVFLLSVFVCGILLRKPMTDTQHEGISAGYVFAVFLYSSIVACCWSPMMVVSVFLVPALFAVYGILWLINAHARRSGRGNW